MYQIVCRCILFNIDVCITGKNYTVQCEHEMRDVFKKMVLSLACSIELRMNTGSWKSAKKA